MHLVYLIINLENTKMKILKILSLLFVLSLLASCNQDQDTLIETTETQPDRVVFVEAAFQGFVQDEDGNPISEANITMNGQTSRTSEDGFYQLKGEGNEKGVYLKVVKEGYFDAYANVSPSSLPKQVNFNMLARKATGTFTSTQDGSITTDNYSIDFKANSFKDASTDAAYDGEVTVFASYVDPTNNLNTVTGDLLGLNEESNSIILSSYGMVHVELEGSNGQSLQLSQEADLSIRIPDSKLESAPSTIPLWYFDTDTGLWVIEGAAELNNGIYKGSVSHFTLWNADLDFDFYELSGSVKLNGNAVTNVLVQLEWVEQNDIKTTFLDANGEFSGKVPQNATIIAKVADYCGDLVLGQDLGIISSDTDVTLDLALEPCNSSDQYGLYFGFNGDEIYSITGGVTVESVDPVTSLYNYHFEFTDSQDIEIDYDYYVLETVPGTFEFVIEVSGITDNTDVYRVVGSFSSSDIEETNEYVYISAKNIRYEIHTGGNFVWYNGDFSIRGEK